MEGEGLILEGGLTERIAFLINTVSSTESRSAIKTK